MNSFFSFQFIFSMVLYLSALIFATWMTIDSFRKHNTLRFVGYFLSLVYEIILVLYPLIFSLFTNFELELEINVSNEEISQVVAFHAIYLIIFQTLSQFVFPRKLSSLLLDSPRSQNKRITALKFETITIISINFLGLYLFLSILLSPTISFEESLQHGTIVSSSSISELLTPWLYQIAAFPGLIAATILVSNPRYSLKWKILGYSVVFSRLFSGVLSGNRGTISIVAELFLVIGIMAIFRQKTKRLINHHFIIAIMLFCLGIVVFPMVVSLRANMFSLEGSGNYFQLMRTTSFTEVASQGKHTDTQGFWAGLADRAQGPRNSVFLLRAYKNGDCPGFSIIVGTMFYLIPRLIWPEKPSAGSPDIDPQNSAMFRVMSDKGIERTMGPFLPSLHAYWEGGLLGIILASLTAAFLWSFLFAWYEQSPSDFRQLIVLILATSLVIDGFLTIHYPIYSYINIFLKSILPILFGYLISRLLAAIFGYRIKTID